MILLLKVTASHYFKASQLLLFITVGAVSKLGRKFDPISFVPQSTFRNHNIIFHCAGSTAYSIILKRQEEEGNC